MTKELQKKILLNALSELHDRYTIEGFNELLGGRGLLEGVTKEEKAEIENEWIKLFPREAQEYDNKLTIDQQVVDVLEKIVKQL